MWPLYCKIKVLSLPILIQIEKAKTMYKFEHKMLPQVFDNYFQKPTHQHNTRYATTHNNFQVVRISSAKETSLLKYYGPKVWASIPSEIKESQSLKVFVNAYRTHLIGHYFEYFGWHEIKTWFLQLWRNLYIPPLLDVIPNIFFVPSILMESNFSKLTQLV